MCRNTGVKKYMHTGIQEYRFQDVQEQRCREVQKYRCREVQEYMCRDVYCTGIQVYRSTGEEMCTLQEYSCTGVQEYRSTGVGKHSKTESEVSSITREIVQLLNTTLNKSLAFVMRRSISIQLCIVILDDLNFLPKVRCISE